MPHSRTATDRTATGGSGSVWRPLPLLRGGERPRIALVVNVDWFFLSHRLPLAQAAQEAGADVTVIAADTGRGAEITNRGLSYVALDASRHGTTPRGELRTFRHLNALYRSLRPDLVHHVTVKPVLYGSTAAWMQRVPAVVNAVTGLGSVLTSQQRPLLRRLMLAAYRAALRNPRSRTIFQNPDDRDFFVGRGLLRPGQCVLIRGSGVDCNLFVMQPEPDGTPVVMLAARMLWDKGVGAFVEAARLLQGRGVTARFALVGDADEVSFMAVPPARLRAWEAEGLIEWWGGRADMHQVLPEAAIVVLPSRREGLPKVLLEAAACARPLVATDVPGCREIVRVEQTGELVPWQDAPALAAAIERLLADPALRRRYGEAARSVAMDEFSTDIVVRQTLDLYAGLLQPLADRSAEHGSG